MVTKRKRPSYIEFPCTVLCDSAEKYPYQFLGIKSDARRKYAPYNVTCERVSLWTGDYSLKGHSGEYSIDGEIFGEEPLVDVAGWKGTLEYDSSAEKTITIERKNPQDFIQSLIDSRRTFEDSVSRMNEFAHAFIVVEAELSEIITLVETTTKKNPFSILQTINSWNVQYPRVQWKFVPGRRFAEITTFRLLQFAYERFQRANK